MALFDFCGRGKEKRMIEANEVMGKLKSEEQRIKQGKYLNVYLNLVKLNCNQFLQVMY